MVTNGYTPFKKFTIFLDILLTVISLILAYLIRSSFIFDHWGELFSIHQYLWVFWIIIPVWPVVLKQFGIYDSVITTKRLGSYAFSLLKAVLIASLILASALYVVKDNLFSRLFFAFFVSFNFVSLLAEKLIIKYIFGKPRNRFNDIKVIVVSGSEGVAKLADLASEAEDVKVNIIGYLSINGCFDSVNGIECLGILEDLSRIMITKTIDEVIFILPKDYIPEIEGYIIDCEKMGITVRMLLDIYNIKLAKTQISYMGNLPMLTFHTVSLDENQKFMKRFIDIIGSIVGLIITGILYAILGPLIKLESKGPIIYSQVRVGQNGRQFKIYKFRTMYVDADEKKKELEHLNMMKGAMFKVENDPRITKMGRFIRSLSLDEFPQFFNVLKGEMSLVGTRPPTIDEVEQYEVHQRRRLSIKPGITGLWQVNGRNLIEDFDKIVQLDVQYIDNWSIWLDIKILFKTLSAIVNKTGL